MPLDDCIAKHTHRQYRLWLAWLDQQWERPDRTDYYLMQIAAEVRKVLAKNRKQIEIEHFGIPSTFWDRLFKRKPATPPEQQKVSKAQAAISKATWFAFLGVKQQDKTNLSDEQ